MTNENLELLKEVLSVSTVTYDESRMVKYLSNYLLENGYHFFLDEKNNIYVTKGESEYYPCVIAHTDTVHKIEPIHVVEVEKSRPETYGKKFPKNERRLMLEGRSAPMDGKPVGIGGDDKCGIYTCLRLLKEFDVLKVAFFVSEETGCHGSKLADVQFFSNVAYTIQFDAPGNHLVTEICMGVRLFERDSVFFEKVNTILSDYGDFLYDSHPYTDIWMIKSKFDHACINLSCGYYNMHRVNELVDVEDVEQTVQIGKSLISSLGTEKYLYRVDIDDDEINWDEDDIIFDNEEDEEYYNQMLAYYEWKKKMEREAMEDYRRRLSNNRDIYYN